MSQNYVLHSLFKISILSKLVFPAFLKNFRWMLGCKKHPHVNQTSSTNSNCLFAEISSFWSFPTDLFKTSKFCEISIGKLTLLEMANPLLWNDLTVIDALCSMGDTPAHLFKTYLHNTKSFSTKLTLLITSVQSGCECIILFVRKILNQNINKQEISNFRGFFFGQILFIKVGRSGCLENVLEKFHKYINWVNCNYGKKFHVFEKFLIHVAAEEGQADF